MKKVLSLIIILPLTLAGCSYGSDVDELAFVVGIGLEPGNEYNYRLTFVFGAPTSSGEGGKTDQSKVTDIVSLEAPSLYSGVRRLNAIKSKNIILTHTKIVVLSDKLAASGVGDIINTLSSSHDFRPNTLLCVSSGSPGDYLSSVNPKQETFIEKYYDHMLQKVVSDSVNESYLFYFYFNLSSPFGSFLPLVGVNEDPLSKEPPKNNFFDDFSVNDFAGDIVKKAENNSQIGGSAVFRKDKLVAKLGSFYTDISRMLCDEFPPSSYSFREPQTGKFVTLRLVQERKSKTKATIKNGKASIKKEVYLNARYIDPASVITNKKTSDVFLRYIEDKFNEKGYALIEKSQKEYKSDFLGLGESAKKLFKDNSEWENFKWDEKYPQADIDITFHIVSADFDEIK